MSNQLDGTVALVTGASSGIGTATAEALAALGATVALAARRTERISELADKIRAGGGNARHMSINEVLVRPIEQDN